MSRPASKKDKGFSFEIEIWHCFPKEQIAC